MAEGERLEMENEQDGPPTSMNLASPENFSKVAFTNIQHYYPPNTDIKCGFHIRKGFQSGTRDWVGIFKVGWQTTKEYYTWVSASNSGEGHVLFKAYYLPKDEEYYQFCYVDHNGEVRGISVPFQLRANRIEDENDIVLVTTEEEIEKIHQEKRMLEEEKQTQAELIQILQAELRSTSEKTKTMEKENQDLQFRVKCLEEEKESLMKNTFTELEQYKKKVQDLLSEMKQMNTLMEKIEAEKKQLQSENMAKQQALEKISGVMEKYREEAARLKAELEAQAGVLETEKKLKADLQCLLDEENKKLVDEENKMKEIQKQLISTRQKMTTLEQNLASLESENITKGEEEEKLRTTIAHLEFEVTTLRDGCKEHLRIIEKEKKENGSLEELLDRQNQKLLYAENKITELQTQLKFSRQNMATLEQKVALLENENRRKTEEVSALQDTIDLRKEEFEDLSAARIRNLTEIEELNRQLRQAQLSAATSPIRPFPSQAAGLYFGNPYEEAASGLVRENEPTRRFETRLVQENRPPRILTCPVCSQMFPSDAAQVYQDHVMCHTHEDTSLPHQLAMRCEMCSQVILGDMQMYDDHMMCHRLEGSLDN